MEAKFVSIKRLLVVVLLLCVSFSARTARCHDIQIVNPVLGTLSGGSAAVSFSVTWNNSWRSSSPPNNWDAAWVFVKFKKNGGSWSHASLNDSGHVVPGGAVISNGLADTGQPFNIATNPVVGVFIYRSANAPSSTFTVNNVALSWNYAQDGVADGDSVQVQLFGIEMVYVPQGEFFAGDNATSPASFRQGSGDTDPWYIGSENAFSTGAQSGSGSGVNESASEYYYASAGNTGEDTSGATFSVPAVYPKGFRSFYMMKGEISQGHWVAFFNTLADSQRSSRDVTDGSGKGSDAVVFRNNVSWPGVGDAVLDDTGGGARFSAVAMNYLGWGDVAAYLDWAGLRPMSELEFERAGRGPYRAFAGEYAWGNASITGATVINSGGTRNESAESAANCVYNSAAGVQGPMRVGAMAYGKATRAGTGSGYFGTMDLSGNLREVFVTVGNAAGRSFDGGKHGNGTLSSAGEANVATWPASTGSGAGFGGGDWSSGAAAARLSDRTNRSADATIRGSASGGRGVRTAGADGGM
jgi:formylglycine-generating enzyme required for sulfatase activity